MSIEALIASGSVSITPTTTIDDVHDVVNYIGTGAEQILPTTVDLTGGGLVITAGVGQYDTVVYDSVRGSTSKLVPRTTAAAVAGVAPTFGNQTLTIPATSTENENGLRYTAMIFKKHSGFLDIVSYTGDGNASKTIAHSLGTKPGMIFVKCTSHADNWYATHRTLVELTGGPGFPNWAASWIAGGGDPNRSTQSAIGFGCGGAGGVTRIDVFNGTTDYLPGGDGFIGGGGGSSDFAVGSGGVGAVVVSYGDTTEIYVSGTTWTIPAGVTSVKTWAIGGGGGPGSSNEFSYWGGGAGAVTWKTWSTTPGQTMTFSPGIAGVTTLGSPQSGGTTTVTYNGVTISAAGGRSGTESLAGAGGPANTTNADGSIAGGSASGGPNSESYSNSGYTIYPRGCGGGIGLAHAPSRSSLGLPFSTSYYTASGRPGAQANDVSGLFAALKKSTKVWGTFITSTTSTTTAAGNLGSMNGTATEITSMSSTSFGVRGAGFLNLAGRQYIAYIFGHDNSDTGLVNCSNAKFEWYTKAQTFESPSTVTTRNPATAFVASVGRGKNFQSAGGAVAHTMAFGSTELATMHKAGTPAMLPMNIFPGNTFNGTKLTNHLLGSYATKQYAGAPLPFNVSDTNLPGLSLTMEFPKRLKTAPAKIELFDVQQFTKVAATKKIITTTNDAAAALILGRSSPSYNTLWSEKYLTGYNVSTGTTNSTYLTSKYTYGDAFTDNGIAIAATGLSAQDYMLYSFSEYPGFFDLQTYPARVPYQASSSLKHNLGVSPEMMIIGGSYSDTKTFVWHKDLSVNDSLILSESAAKTTNSNFSFVRTSTTVTLGYNLQISGEYTPFYGIGSVFLFGTLPGYSKVGSYTGNGGTQTLDCGFIGGARFVMIRRADASGNWYFWDTVRGITVGNEPVIPSDSGTEVTTADSLDPSSAGFIVNQNATTNINVNGGFYIFLAIA